MWSGSEFDYNGINCTFTGIFNKSEQFEDRVDTAISWFSHPKTPANLVMLYIEQPDEFSHAYGYESPVVSTLFLPSNTLKNVFSHNRLFDVLISVVYIISSRKTY